MAWAQLVYRPGNFRGSSPFPQFEFLFFIFRRAVRSWEGCSESEKLRRVTTMRRNSNKCSERMIPSILRCSASSDAMVKTLNLGNERLLREDFRNQVKSGCLRGNNQFQNKCEMIGSLDGYYVFEHPKLRKRSVNKHVGHHENLRQEPGIHPNQKLDVSLLCRCSLTCLGVGRCEGGEERDRNGWGRLQPPRLREREGLRFQGAQLLHPCHQASNMLFAGPHSLRHLLRMQMLAESTTREISGCGKE
ncbi:unnamed protein product, partial [Nesidiocoris tenuis]